MKCLLYCPDSYLRYYWDHYLRQHGDHIFHFLQNDLEVLEYYDFDRIVFCQEHEFLNFKAKNKNIHTMYAGEKKELKQEYNVVYFWQDIKKIVDWMYEKKEISSSFNATTMHKVMPVLFNALVKKRSGLHQLVDPIIYKGEKVAEFYGVKDVKLIEDRVLKSTSEIEGTIDWTEKKKVNIYTPTYYRYEKTKQSIESIIASAKKSKYDIEIYIGDNNTKIPEMNDWLVNLDVEVYFSPENIGKANMINLLHRKARQSDYIINIDSDMIIEEQTHHPLDRMIECLEKCDNVGLVSSNQKDCNQHWFGRGVNKGQERGIPMAYSPDCVGIAGGCIVLRWDDWTKVGGYKENHDIYTGDDGILTYNINRKLGKRVLVAVDAEILHPAPKEDEKGYTEWKSKSWQRDGLKFIKDNYNGSNKKGYFD